MLRHMLTLALCCLHEIRFVSFYATCFLCLCVFWLCDVCVCCDCVWRLCVVMVLMHWVCKWFCDGWHWSSMVLFSMISIYLYILCFNNSHWFFFIFWWCCLQWCGIVLVIGFGLWFGQEWHWMQIVIIDFQCF